MSKKIALTAERKKIIADSFDEYLAVGLSTAPADFDAAWLPQGAGLTAMRITRQDFPPFIPLQKSPAPIMAWLADVAAAGGVVILMVAGFVLMDVLAAWLGAGQ